jgi:branched-chain amino acid aminotransferase
MFVINNVVITPALSDSILAGITRNSVLHLARHWGMKVEERKISVTELVQALENGMVEEAFGAGTAATIAQIELIGYEGKNYQLPPVSERKFSNKVYQELEGIKRGLIADPFDWMMKI